MRRWGEPRVHLLVVLVATVIGVGMGAVASPPRASACSMAALTVDFDGTVMSVDGPRVTYRVERVRPGEPDGGAPRRGPALGPGKTVVVHYEPATTLLRTGDQYRVRGWSYRSNGVSSQIAYAFHGDCGTGAGTTALDGTYLASASGTGMRWWPYLLALLVMAGLLLAAHRVTSRRADRKLAGPTDP